jgi:hypothetical protein
MADDPITDFLARTKGPGDSGQAAAPDAGTTSASPTSDLAGDFLARTGKGPSIVADASAAKPGDVDPITGKPYQFASSGTPGPVGASTGTPIREDQVPGAATQAIISLAGDPEQKRRIAAAQIFPDLKPLEAQSRLFYGPNGRLAAVGDDGTAYYVDPLASDRTLLGVPVPSNPLAYVASGAGPALPAAGATVASSLATPGLAPLAGAAGGAAGDVARQALAAKFDPGSPKYDPKATLGAAGTGALIGTTGAVGNALAESGPAISGVSELPPKGSAGPAVVPSAVGPASRNSAITQDIPTSSASAEALAKPYYRMAETSGAGSTSQGTDAIIGLAEDKAPKGLVGAARGGPVPDFVKWVQQFKGKPLTYEDLSNINDELGQRISKDYTFPEGLSKQGKDLFDIQTAIRQRLLNPQEGDLSGDASGFAAKRAGDQAWAQAKKMEDVERMWAKANDTLNPDTSFANQVRNYKYSAKARGWSDDEIAALDAAAKGGVGSIMHVLGSRMLEHTLTAAGTALGGFLGTATPIGPVAGAVIGGGTSAGVSHAFGSFMRSRAAATTERGVQNALTVLGSRTPPSVLTPP